MQMCWLVPDLEAAIDGWVRSAGVGPFFWFDDVGATEGRHRGKPAEFPRARPPSLRRRHADRLVCQENDDPGIFRDLFPAATTACTTWRVVCDDYEADRAAYVATGAEVAYEAQIGGRTRTCWIDTSPTLGFMVELLERSRARDMGFAAMRAAAESWDGHDPITSLLT